MMGNELFTRDEVCAVQYTRRMLVKHLPKMNTIEEVFVGHVLDELNTALAKMEKQCDDKPNG